MMNEAGEESVTYTACLELALVEWLATRSGTTKFTHVFSVLWSINEVVRGDMILFLLLPAFD